jgi:hypothetical protein
MRLKIITPLGIYSGQNVNYTVQEQIDELKANIMTWLKNNDDMSLYTDSGWIIIPGEVLKNSIITLE